MLTLTPIPIFLANRVNSDFGKISNYGLELRELRIIAAASGKFGAIVPDLSDETIACP